MVGGLGCLIKWETNKICTKDYRRPKNNKSMKLGGLQHSFDHK